MSRKRRKKRNTRIGDSIFISIEGHENDDNLVEINKLTKKDVKNGNNPQKAIIKVDFILNIKNNIYKEFL